MTRETTLGNSTRQKLRTLQDDIEALPAPGKVWEWQDGLDAVGPSALEKMKYIDAVERVGENWWRVTPRVAEWMSRVHDVEPDGKTGQDTLPSGQIIPGFDRRGTSNSRSPGRQVTLDGDPVQVESGSVKMHVHDDDPSPGSDVPPQRRLDRIDKWLPDPDGDITITFGI